MVLVITQKVLLSLEQINIFTDAKRNVVVKLTGSSAQNEILTVISNEGMRSWFRDLFAEASATQKLGGYDPYMHEYVFTTNTIVKPETELCTACGVTKNITIVARSRICLLCGYRRRCRPSYQNYSM